MSEARRLQLSLLVSLLINAAAFLMTGWFWHFQPVPASVPRPRIKLVRVAVFVPPVPKPVLSVTLVPPPLPKPHLIKPKPLIKHRRPGARVKSSAPAPPAKAAGGSDAGAAAPPIAAAPPVPVISRNQPAPLIVHNLPVTLPPLPIPSIVPGVITAPPLPKAVPTAQAGHGASGVDTSGKGAGAGEGAGVGSGSGSGSSRDAGEPFGVGRGLAGDGGPRHIVYVLDISGSMTSRIVRADAEIRKAMAGLRPDETFDIIAFNNEVHSFDTELAPATPGAIKQASAFLDSLYVNDGTDTQAGLAAALSIPDVNEIVLLTDGVPGLGITDPDSLADFIRHRNKNHARISCVGMVGKDQDGIDRTFEATSLLQQIAHDSGGACEIVPLGYATGD
ncbi:MAG: VWA domain-containing protein [Janthinobacterium lividum]